MGLNQVFYTLSPEIGKQQKDKALSGPYLQRIDLGC